MHDLVCVFGNHTKSELVWIRTDKKHITFHVHNCLVPLWSCQVTKVTLPSSNFDILWSWYSVPENHAIKVVARCRWPANPSLITTDTFCSCQSKNRRGRCIARGGRQADSNSQNGLHYVKTLFPRICPWCFGAVLSRFCNNDHTHIIYKCMHVHKHTRTHTHTHTHTHKASYLSDSDLLSGLFGV